MSDRDTRQDPISKVLREEFRTWAIIGLIILVYLITGD